VLHDAPPAAPSVAPARALNPKEQAAILSWAGRAQRLTPARFEELAELAVYVLPDDPTRAARRQPVQGLLGVAQWLMGSRT
jgi:hypothetical protein